MTITTSALPTTRGSVATVNRLTIPSGKLRTRLSVHAVSVLVCVIHSPCACDSLLLASPPQYPPCTGPGVFVCECNCKRVLIPSAYRIYFRGAFLCACVSSAVLCGHVIVRFV